MWMSFKQLLVPLLIVSSGFVCLEFSLPVAVGEFIAGIIGGAFLSSDETGWMELFSQLGLLSIMFLAGFEIDIKILKKNLKANLFIGCNSFFVPYLLLTVTCLLIGLTVKQSLVIGACLSTTSLAIIFMILRDRNTLHSLQGQIFLGAAMVVDMLSMLVLGVTLFEYTIQNAIFLLGLATIFWFSKKIIIFVFNKYQGNRAELELKTILLLLPVIGLIAEGAGLHGAIVAFLLGMTLSDIDPEHEEIIAKLSAVVYSLLAPLFFFHAGTLIVFDSLTGHSVLLFLILGSVAFISKQLATQYSIAFIFKKDKDFPLYGGILFNYRLSFGIVGAIYAIEKEIISKELASVVLLLIAVSSVVNVILEKKFSPKVISPTP